MAAAVAQSLSSLLQRSTLDDHEELLKAANNTLKKTKSDIEAQHVRLVALIKLDRYEDALRVVEDAGQLLRERAPLECAYALYKNGWLDEAEQLLAGQTTRGMRHLAAQVAYRTEKFEEAAQLFKELSGQEADDEGETTDLSINSGATDAQLTWAGQGHLAPNKKPTSQALQHFETAFNLACDYIASGELRRAEIALERSISLCKAADELSDSDKEIELLAITVQKLYVLSRLGKIEEADKLSSTLNISHIVDQATRHIAQVNYLATSSTSQNPYLAHRLFNDSSKLSPKDRPFRYQSSVLAYDALALDLQAAKYTGVANATQANSTAQSRSTSEAAARGVLNAAAHARCQTGKLAVKEVSALLERSPKDLGILLTLVQLHLSGNNINAATALVESFAARLDSSSTEADQALRFTPGFLAILVVLYSQQGRTAQSKAELAKAAAFWKKNAGVSQSSISGLRAAGAALLESATTEDFETARGIFSTIIEQNPQDSIAIAGLVASTSPSDSPLPAQYTDKLQPLSKLTSGIDVSALEAAGVAQPNAPSVAASSKKRSAPGAQAAPEKAKKSRKSKLPKDYDPAKAPDPERWLPLRDRSNYKPKGKKKAKLGGGTQGGITNEESRPSTPSQVVKQAVVAKPKKKKGKGGK